MFRRRSLLPVLASCAWLAVSATASAQQTAAGQFPPYRPQQETRPQPESTSRPGMSSSGISSSGRQSQYAPSRGGQRPYTPPANGPAATAPGGRVYQAGYNEPAHSQPLRQNPEYNPVGSAGQSRSPQPERNAGTSAAEPRQFPENGPFPVAGQSAALPRQPAESDTRQLPVLRISRDGQEASGAGQNIRRTKSTGSGLWTSFASLAVLILLMLGGARLWKRHGPRMGSVIPGEAVEVLGRRPVDARHSIVLVRLGSRILVLSAGAGGLQTLTELSDPVEVDFLAGQCRQQAAEGAVAQTFRSLFQLESLRGREQTAARAADRTAGRTTDRTTDHPSERASAAEAHRAAPGHLNRSNTHGENASNAYGESEYGENVESSHGEDDPHAAVGEYAAGSYYSAEDRYPASPSSTNHPGHFESSDERAWANVPDEPSYDSDGTGTGAASPAASGASHLPAEPETFAARNQEDSHLPAQQTSPSGPATDFSRSPSRDSEAILQRLRMHSLSSGTPRSSSSAGPAPAAASDEETDSSGRQYHEAG